MYTAANLCFQLPSKSYLTIGDVYMLFCFVYHALLVLKVILAFQGLGHGVGFFWYSADEASVEEDEWDSKQRFYQKMDDASSWACVLIWLLVHLVAFCDVALRGHDKKNSRGFLDQTFRPTWEEVLNKIRPAFEIVKGMNKPVVSSGRREDGRGRRGSLIEDNDENRI